VELRYTDAVMLGGVDTSEPVTVNWSKPEFPAASYTLQYTMVAPIGKSWLNTQNELGLPDQ